MDWPIIVASVLMCLAGSIVGATLLRRALSTGVLADYLVAIGLLAYGLVAQGGRLLTLLLDPDSDPTLLFLARAYQTLGFGTVLVSLSLFTLLVFGRDTIWRMLLFAAISLTAVISCGVILDTLWRNAEGMGDSLKPWAVNLGIAFLAAYSWTASESLRYHGLMRRRSAVGLADPVVTNRFLLWGGGCAVSTALVLCSVMMLAIGLPPGNPISGLFILASGLVNTVVWWLSFMPPRPYTDWVRAENAAQA